MNRKYFATVKRIVDGDTFQVEDKFGNTQVIRLFSVDTPEKQQTFGMTAKQYTSDLIYKKEVEIQPIELGQYNRVVAIVKINGESLGEILISNGIAFAAGSNHVFSQRYYALQEKARVNNRGLWKLGIENPAVFRKKNKKWNPTFGKSGRPDPLPIPRFKPAKPTLLDKVTDFFSTLIEKNKERIQQKDEIKNSEGVRKEDKKMEDDLKRRMELRKLTEVSKDSPISKKYTPTPNVPDIDTSDFKRRIKEKTKHM
jgi:micrococcal nuclease